MSNFIKSSLCFFAPFLLLIPIELSLRNNTFKATTDFINNNKDQIEILVTGSSHTWKGVNPEYMDRPTAVLAHGGIGFDINLMLFNKYIHDLPKVKVVFFDITPGFLEGRVPPHSNKNHLYYIYYGINNYSGSPPLKDKFLLTSNPKNYLDKFIYSLKDNKNDAYNKYGFVTQTPLRFDDFKKANYDSTTIANTFDYSLIKKHSNINDTHYNYLTAELDKAIDLCLQKGVKVVLMSTPKYYLYVNNLNQTILDRRDQYLSKYKNADGVHIWDYESLWLYEERYYTNVNHLNVVGAEAFTKTINSRIYDLIQ